MEEEKKEKTIFTRSSAAHAALAAVAADEVTGSGTSDIVGLENLSDEAVASSRSFPNCAHSCALRLFPPYHFHRETLIRTLSPTWTYSFLQPQRREAGQAIRSQEEQSGSDSRHT